MRVFHWQIGGKGFTETDKPNYEASFYSKTKGMVEDLLTSYSNICILRSPLSPGR